ncbi:MAG: Cu(I)-responsive transcriptional regulator [Rhodospirillaceae bacterium]
MHIGAVAEATGISAKTIRYYESIGLTPRPERRENGYRDYGANDVATLRFVQRARGLGFPLEEVRALLALWRDQDRASADVKQLALDHIGTIEDRIAELETMKRTLQDLTRRCHGDDRPDCPILEDLAKLK